MAGHSRELRTFKRLAQQFYWPSIHNFVRDYVTQCATCEKIKSDILAPAGLLQPLTIPCQVRDDIPLDFIRGYPSSYGKDIIMVEWKRLPAENTMWETFQLSPNLLHWTLGTRSQLVGGVLIDLFGGLHVFLIRTSSTCIELGILVEFVTTFQLWVFSFRFEI